MRTKAARDHNEPEIVDALRKAGYYVVPLSDGGVPDLLVIRPGSINADRLRVVTTAEQALEAARAGMITLIEVKQENGRLTAKQRKFREKALGIPETDT